MWRFRYFGDWDNLRLYPTSGAYHGSDLEMIFGASQDVSGLPKSAAQRQLQATMMHAWAAFADNPQSGLEKLGWPRYDPNRELTPPLRVVVLFLLFGAQAWRESFTSSLQVLLQLCWSASADSS